MWKQRKEKRQNVLGSDWLWDDLVRSWPYESSHPMVNCSLMEYELDCEDLGRVQQYAPQEWYDLKSDTVYKGSVWKGEKVKSIDTFTGFLFVEEERIWRTKASLKYSIENYPKLFCSRQEAALRYRLGITFAAVAETRQKDPERKQQFLYVVSKGLSVEDIVAFEGRPGMTYYSYVSGETEIFFCDYPRWIQVTDSYKVQEEERDESGNVVREEKWWEKGSLHLHSEASMWNLPTQYQEVGGERIEMSLFQKYTWQRYTHKVTYTTDYLSLDLYKYHRFQYAQWVYDQHFSQVNTQIQRLSLEVPLTAPGDGIGLVSSITDREVIAGDLFPLGGGVKMEPFLDTMKRGKGALILSYVSSYFTPLDWDFANNWLGPVLVIDTRSVPFLERMEKVGEGIYCRGFPPLKEIAQPVEGFHVEEVVLFSENLLRLPFIADGLGGSGERYWKSMRPLAKSQDVGPLIASTIQEFMIYKKSSRWKVKANKRSIWLQPAGRLVQRPVLAAIRPGVVLQERTLYKVRKPSPFKSGVIWYEDEKWFYFVSSREYEWKQDTFSIFFGKEERSNIPVQLVFAGEEQIVWDYTGKTYVWKSTLSNRGMAKRYLERFGERGWRAKFPILRGAFYKKEDDLPMRNVPEENRVVKRSRSPMEWDVGKDNGSFEQLARTFFYEREIYLASHERRVQMSPEEDVFQGEIFEEEDIWPEDYQWSSERWDNLCSMHHVHEKSY